MSACKLRIFFLCFDFSFSFLFLMCDRWSLHSQWYALWDFLPLCPIIWRFLGHLIISSVISCLQLPYFEASPTYILMRKLVLWQSRLHSFWEWIQRQDSSTLILAIVQCPLHNSILVLVSQTFQPKLNCWMRYAIRRSVPPGVGGVLFCLIYVWECSLID